MKKQFDAGFLRRGLTIALLAITTLSFAQRGDRGGRGDGGRGNSGGGSQRGGGQSYNRSFSQRQSQSAPSYSQRQTPRVQSYQQSGRGDNRVMAYNYRNVPRVNRYSNNSVGVNRGGSYRPSAGVYYRPRYSRPPVVYNGSRYYAHNVYSYHPYRPYYYGSFFHPFGYFTVGLSSYAYPFYWNNQNYWYDQGTYYQPYNNGYQSVPAPKGATVNDLPGGYTAVTVNGAKYFYYAGTFYINGEGGFAIVPAPPGAIVYDLPEGAKETVINGTTYVNYNDTWYLPVTIDGKDAYEVVDVEADDNF